VRERDQDRAGRICRNARGAVRRWACAGRGSRATRTRCDAVRAGCSDRFPRSEGSWPKSWFKGRCVYRDRRARGEEQGARDRDWTESSHGTSTGALLWAQQIGVGEWRLDVHSRSAEGPVGTSGRGSAVGVARTQHRAGRDPAVYFRGLVGARGDVAQLEEHRVRIAGVRGSSPLISTIPLNVLVHRPGLGVYLSACLTNHSWMGSSRPSRTRHGAPLWSD
jgi:hypothetical protein